MGCCSSAEEYDPLSGRPGGGPDDATTTAGSGSWQTTVTVEYGRSTAKRGGGESGETPPMSPVEGAGTSFLAPGTTTSEGTVITAGGDEFAAVIFGGKETGGMRRRLGKTASVTSDSELGTRQSAYAVYAAAAAGVTPTRAGATTDTSADGAAFAEAAGGFTPAAADGSASPPPPSREGATTPPPSGTTVIAIPPLAPAAAATVAAPARSFALIDPATWKRAPSGMPEIRRPPMISEGNHRVMSLYQGNNWTKFTSDGKISAHTHPVEWSQLAAGRFQSLLTPAGCCEIMKKEKLTPAVPESMISPRDLFVSALATIADDDGMKPVKELNIFKFDTILENYERRGPDAATGGSLIHLYYTSPVWGIAKRDQPGLVTRMELTKDLQQHYGFLAMDIADEANVPRVTIQSMMEAPGVPDKKGYQRSILHIQGYVIREMPDGVEINMMLCGEPGGSIPLWIVDKLRSEQMKMVGILRKLITQHLVASRK